MSKRGKGRPNHLGCMLPPSKWAAVVAIGAVIVQHEIHRRARRGAYGPLAANGTTPVDVPDPEISKVIEHLWNDIVEQSGLAHALYYLNPTKDELRRRKREAVYLKKQIETLMQSRSRREAEPTDRSGLTATQRSRNSIRRHRNHIRKQIAAATKQLMSTPPDAPLHRLFFQYLTAVHRDISQLLCSNPEHRHCREEIATRARKERETIAKLALEAALASG